MIYEDEEAHAIYVGDELIDMCTVPGPRKPQDNLHPVLLQSNLQPLPGNLYLVSIETDQ